MTPERIAALRIIDTLTDENQRLHDLVRHQRGPLFDAGLITEEEYAALAGDHGAVKRLEGYDAARIERDELAATLANERGEGEPPAGWRPDGHRGGAWGWTRIGDSHELDTYFVTGRAFDGTPFRGWAWRVIEAAGFCNVVARGRCDTARAAMRAADAAVPTTTAPEVPRAD